MDDLRIVATRLWDLSGRRPVRPQDLVESLYAKLRWFPPSEAAHVVERLQQEGFFVPGGPSGSVVGAASLDDVAVPITYRPPADLLSAPSSRAPSTPAPPGPTGEEPLLFRILAEAARPKGEDAIALRQEAREVEEHLKVLPEAAALLVAWRRGVAVAPLREELEIRLRQASPRA